MNPVFASGNAGGRLRAATIIGLILVLPFVILEVWLGRTTGDLPWMLFGALWLLPFMFVLSWPIAARGAGSTTRLRVTLRLLGGAGLILVAAAWLSLVADQMPCFLGVPNCD